MTMPSHAEPDQEKIGRKNARALMVKYLSYLLPSIRAFVGFSLLGFAVSGFLLFLPYCSKWMIDIAFPQKDYPMFLMLCGVAASLFVSVKALTAWRAFIGEKIRISVYFRMERALIQKLAALDSTFFLGKRYGESQFKLFYDADRVSQFMVKGLSDALQTAFRLVLTLFFIWTLNPRVACASVMIAPILFLAGPRAMIKKRKSVMKHLAKQTEQYFAKLGEFFSHHFMMKAFGAEKKQVRRLTVSLIQNMRQSIAHAKWEMKSQIWREFLEKSLLGGVAFYGGLQVIKGQATVGNYLALLMYLGQILPLESQVVWFFQSFSLSLVSCERLGEIENAVKAHKPLARILSARRRVDAGEVTLENLTFGYQGQAVLEGLDLRMPCGTHTALVGASGVGKSTLLHLILGLYKPWQGRVLIDGTDVIDYDAQALRHQLGIALQKPYLFHETILENIVFGASAEDKKNLDNVLRICGLLRVLEKLPHGIHTHLGEFGERLSEGEKQRVAIARALIKRPTILMLDEALASLDSESETQILTNLKHAMPEMTLITVSHRYSALRQADQICYLQSRSRLIMASLESLLKKPDFASLFEGQISHDLA